MTSSHQRPRRAATLAILVLAGIGIGLALPHLQHVFMQHDTAADGEPRSNTGSDGERRILYYRNPMGLPDISPVPKQDEMGMDYIPVYADEASAEGTIKVAVEKVQRAGVRTEPVRTTILSRTIRGAGTLAMNESAVSVVTAKFDGFVNKLKVRTTGERVTAGEPLMTVWIESPDVLRKMADLASLKTGNRTAKLAADNLRQFDIPDADIAAIAKNGGSSRIVTLNAPSAGTVMQKPAMDGMRFAAGAPLFQIADLSTLWAEIEVPEQDLGHIRKGQPVTLRLPSRPEEAFEGKVSFIYPDINMASRSGRVRVVVPNADGALQTGLFVHAGIAVQLSTNPVPAVPTAAVIDDGKRQVVFVSRGEGVFEPRDVALGGRAGDLIEIRDGVDEGEEVVTHGTFLIDAESNLQSALAAFSAKGDDQ
ncbi:efflux RND transporter periplasmic adaptor subunit [Pseudokordiimonas caeni]|uniref:efflux RND transporter periplasmic adaptor subunit n=1 Tax=Pseudokordiimonas caeni TaxID=2997908 RepID=UPI0028127FE3|nr:efflux RND transporter periplasmic adaptor subunit [Pseudokordiimonas caeni]